MASQQGATETAMKFYLFEVRDSDGNDCTVYDAIVAAHTRDAASSRLWTHLGEMYPDDESDGGYGTHHACDCSCEHIAPPLLKRFAAGEDVDVVGVCEDCSDGWDCSHGGLLTDEDCDPGPQEFSSFHDAMAAHARFHSLIDLSETPGGA